MSAARIMAKQQIRGIELSRCYVMKDRGHKIERMKRYKIENELCLADIFLVQETHRSTNKDKCSST